MKSGSSGSGGDDRNLHSLKINGSYRSVGRSGSVCDDGGNWLARNHFSGSWGSNWGISYWSRGSDWSGRDGSLVDWSSGGGGCHSRGSGSSCGCLNLSSMSGLKGS